MTATSPQQRGRTGTRVELARYSVSAGDRALFGQRVDGVVRVTDVPLAPGGRAYLVERGLEEEGANANAAPQALIADYLRQASILDEVPMAAIPFKRTLPSYSVPKCSRPRGSQERSCRQT